MRYWSPAAILRAPIGHLFRNMQFGTHEIVPATTQTAKPGQPDRSFQPGPRQNSNARKICKELFFGGYTHLARRGRLRAAQPMSALGQKRTFALKKATSALPPKATVLVTLCVPMEGRALLICPRTFKRRKISPAPADDCYKSKTLRESIPV